MSDTLDHPRETDTILNRPIEEDSMLLVLTGPSLGRRIPITPDMERITVGRDEEADLVFNDESMSCTHYVISFEGERWFIGDLKSTNGTYVAHQFIDRVPLEMWGSNRRWSHNFSIFFQSRNRIVLPRGDP